MRTCEYCLGAGCVCAGRPCSSCVNGKSYRYRCPTAEAGDLGRIVVRAYAQWSNGVLPAEGGWGDQGAKISRLVDLVTGEIAEIEEASRKAREKSK